MLVDEVVDYLDRLGAGLALDDTVLDGDGKIVRTTPHMDMRRILAWASVPRAERWSKA